MRKEKNKSRKFLVGKLQNLYCSYHSEFSAFLLFNYQSLVIKNKKLSYIFKSFSLKHLSNSKILANFIINLKGLPFYLNSQNSPLNAFWINPETNLKNILQLNINFLKALIDDYSYTITNCYDKDISNQLFLLKSLNLDELDFLTSLNTKCTNKSTKIDNLLTK